MAKNQILAVVLITIVVAVIASIVTVNITGRTIYFPKCTFVSSGVKSLPNSNFSTCNAMCKSIKKICLSGSLELMTYMGYDKNPTNWLSQTFPIPCNEGGLSALMTIQKTNFNTLATTEMAEKQATTGEIVNATEVVWDAISLVRQDCICC